MARPHLQIILADETIPPSLQAALRRTAATAGFWPLAEALRARRLPQADAIVVVVPEDASTVAGPLRVLFDRLAEHPRATLVVTADGHPVCPLNHPPTLPVSFFSGHDVHDLCGRLTAMLEMRDCLDSLHRGLLANRRSGETIAKQYVNQLRLASQVQREFLPETLPRLGNVSFDVLFRPVDYVSGDIYDVHRLDEEHVGLAIADATGHGIPAALLTVYIKRALRGKEIENGTYRILEPDEVLARLNEDLLDAHLTECPFVAAVYAVLNTRTNELRLARGGAPYPLLRAPDGKTDMLVSEGRVVGATPDAEFEVLTVQLQPGDAVLLCTDGLERIVAPDETIREAPAGLRRAARKLANAAAAAADPRPAGGERGDTATATATLERAECRPTPGRAALRASRFTGSGGGRASAAEADPTIGNSAWFATLRERGAAAALELLSGRQHALRRMGYPLDDLTVLCLRVGE